MKTGKSLLLVCLALSAAAGAANEAAPVSNAKPFPQWQGKWQLSDNLNAALGFVGPKSREGGILDEPPRSFQISLSDKIGDGIDPALMRAYRDTVFKRMNHRIVATGKWEMTFQANPGIAESNCFVTEHEGATYLWVPANYVVVFGGRVSFLEGADTGHDAIVIDFNTAEDHVAGKTRSPDTYAFQRVSR